MRMVFLEMCLEVATVIRAIVIKMDEVAIGCEMVVLIIPERE